MEVFLVILGVLSFLLIAVFIMAYICFRIAFYVPRRNSEKVEVPGLPEGEVYGAFRESIHRWAEETRAMPHEEFSITSFDGLKLYGKYYEYEKGAPIELMFHGYRGSAERDLAGGVQRCFQLKRSALVVDQRCAGKSEGRVITFGVREHRDCLSWIDFMIKYFGDDVKILIAGISMGASTVLIAAGQPLPKNVIGVLADCGYNSARDIIQTVIKQLKLPVTLGYFFVKLGAKVYGRFDPEEFSPEEALKTCTVPVIFFHGEEDDFVPCEMSRVNFNACPTRKQLITIPGAGHGLSYPKDPKRYLKTLSDFFGDEGSYQEK